MICKSRAFGGLGGQRVGTEHSPASALPESVPGKGLWKPKIHQVLWDCPPHCIFLFHSDANPSTHIDRQIYASRKCKVILPLSAKQKRATIIGKVQFFSNDNLVQNATFCKVQLFCCQVQPCANCTEANHQKRPCTLDEPSFAPFALVAKILHGRSMTVPYFQRKPSFFNISWAIPI